MSSPHSTEREPARPDAGTGATDGPLLVAAESPVHGTGVFVTRAVAPADVLEECPVLVLPAHDWNLLAETTLSGYVYDWGDDGAVAIALGHANLVNHSRSPNARYEHDHDARRVRLVALRDLAAGDEVLVNYNGDPHCQDPVWFE